mmetsp:Transcript_75428/g.245357  ORF Transcript_75428/g.245357 Transcript_75428/m.245357 type:complete len:235 (-) Transcript_75428:1036-1740(-)
MQLASRSLVAGLRQEHFELKHRRPGFTQPALRVSTELGTSAEKAEVGTLHALASRSPNSSSKSPLESPDESSKCPADLQHRRRSFAQQALSVSTEFGGSAKKAEGSQQVLFCAVGASDFWQACDELAQRSFMQRATSGGSCPELKVGTSAGQKLAKDTTGISMRPLETFGESSKGSRTLQQRRREFAQHGLSVSTGCEAQAVVSTDMQQVQLGAGCAGSQFWKVVDELAQRRLT